MSRPTILEQIRKVGGTVLSCDGSVIVRDCPKTLLEWCQEHRGHLREEVAYERAWTWRGMGLVNWARALRMMLGYESYGCSGELRLSDVELSKSFLEHVQLGARAADRWISEHGDEWLESCRRELFPGGRRSAQALGFGSVRA